MKRTLMLKNRELLDFEVDPLTGNVRVLDAPDDEDGSLRTLGIDASNLNASVTGLVGGRRISDNRDDSAEILNAFGARSAIELALMGHGASLTDKLWYRAPSSTERWEDVNFLDNNWDPTFCESVLTHNYDRLASCSPDIPDTTTAGHLRKAWERIESGIQLLKESNHEDRVDLAGALLAAELCSLLLGRDAYQPLCVVERYGKRFAASPLMISRDEELVQGLRLFAMCGIEKDEAQRYMGSSSSKNLGDIFSRAGVAASSHVAKIFAFKSLALLADLHAGNYGVIRNVETGACRAAPPFDYDRSFGFPSNELTIDYFCDNPKLSALFCAKYFSDLNPSWDWSWYNPRALDGFEDRIVEAYAPLCGLPPNFASLVARLFVIQRAYVNEVAALY